MGIKVTLTSTQEAWAFQVNQARSRESQRMGLRDKHGLPFADRDKANDQGAPGELAAAIVLGLEWAAPVNNFKGADLSDDIQVRTTHHPRGCLIVRDDDNPNHTYILVRGTSPHFEVMGYIKGRDAKKPQFIRSPNGRPPAYFVPADHLNPISELTWKDWSPPNVVSTANLDPGR